MARGRHPTAGGKSRIERTSGSNNGRTASSSQDFLRVAKLLYGASVAYCRRVPGGNATPYPLAGIPPLFSALRCLLIELNGLLALSFRQKPEVLAALSARRNEMTVLKQYYCISSSLSLNLELLTEVRNEIVHPAHLPGPEGGGTPRYLTPLAGAGFLEGDWRLLWIDKLQSQRLFDWAFTVIADAAEVAIDTNGVYEPFARELKLGYRGDVGGYFTKDLERQWPGYPIIPQRRIIGPTSDDAASSSTEGGRTA